MLALHRHTLLNQRSYFSNLVCAYLLLLERYNQMLFYPTVLWFICYEKGVHLLNIVNPIQAPFAGHNPEPLDETRVYYYDLD